jgi:hypothetical protein
MDLKSPNLLGPEFGRGPSAVKLDELLEVVGIGLNGPRRPVADLEILTKPFQPIEHGSTPKQG